MVAVGAVDSNNQIAWFSSRGPTADGRIKPEVVARGVDTWWADAEDPEAYGTANGTSLSTPLIGGASALLFEAHPEWGPMDLRAALMATADRHGNPDNAYGHGRANVLAALQSAPLLYPYPFSLLAPADGAALNTLSPAFTWRATHDGDSGAAVTYRVSLREASPGGGFPLLISAGSDTTLSLVSALAPETTYRWEVIAEDAVNHRRISRQTWSFTTPAISSLPGTSPTRRAELLVQPNPFAGRLRALFALKSGETPETARWSLLDAAGRRLAGGELIGNGGVYALDWSIGAAGHEPLPGGVYYLEMEAGGTGMRRTVLHLPRGAGR
ncbi:MAG: S8 family serine peptidase [Candidatus Eisenbacteria bacterium]|nr:S8 family serine peptidase [Candidatus Eisenbacteria bacterium]